MSMAARTGTQPPAPHVADSHDLIRVHGARENNLRDVTLDSLHDAVGVVTQDAHMFHDTIRANLAYARPRATEAELIEACRAAQIWELVASLPDGLDTVVGDRGYRLSGGEKQRLAIARVLLQRLQWLVLNGVFDVLDAASRRRLEELLTGELAALGVIDIGKERDHTRFFTRRVNLVVDSQGPSFSPSHRLATA